MPQVTDYVMMIRPSNFGFNAETALNNTFQNKPDEDKHAEIQSRARQEFDQFVNILRKEGVEVMVIDDSHLPAKPDAIFPNNWISFHSDGTIITYPMYSALRRQERRDDIIAQLNNNFIIEHIIRLEEYELHNQFLEGTGSLVLDRTNKIAYASISERTNLILLEQWCEEMLYTPISFHAISHGKPIYHTNVMMAIGSQVAIVCLNAIPDKNERHTVQQHLEAHHQVIEISPAQMGSFAGNMLALKNNRGEELMVMSASALNSLSAIQKEKIEMYARIVASPIPTIEKIGGGSARCMIAEVFLPQKQ